MGRVTTLPILTEKHLQQRNGKNHKIIEERQYSRFGHPRIKKHIGVKVFPSVTKNSFNLTKPLLLKELHSVSQET